MRISVSSLSKHEKIFSSDKFLKLKHIRKNNTYAIEVKAPMSTADRILRFFSNLFGTEYRNISKVLNSPIGQARLKQVGNKAVRTHLAEINKKIAELNKKIFVIHIPLINIPEFSKTSTKPQSSQGKSGPRTASGSPRSGSKSPRLKPNLLLVPFYKKSGTDSDMRTLDDIWNFSLKQKESTHNYIQWLFPLPSESMFNSKAPLLNAELIEDLKGTPEFLLNLRKSLDVMLEFYGLEWNENHTEIILSPNFDERAKVWLNIDDHNHKRLTRILECLRIFDLDKENQALFAILKEIKNLHPKKISDKAWNFWEQAALNPGRMTL